MKKEVLLNIEKARGVLNKFAVDICLVTFYLIIISAIKGMINESYGATVLCIPFLSLLCMICRKFDFKSGKHIKTIQLVAHVFSFSFTIFVAVYGNVKYTWDWGQILQTATKLTLEGVNDNPEYYLRYPNNQFWLSVITIYFKLLHRIKGSITPTELKLASMILSILFIRASCFFVFLSCKEMFDSKKAIILDIILMLYLPIHLYSYFAYTDTSGLFCVSVMIYLFLKIKKTYKERYKWWILLIIFAFVTALLVQVKIMGFIIFIGMLLSELLNRKIALSKIVKKYTIIFIFLIAFTFVLEKGTNVMTKLDLSQAEKYEFPPIHWVMMGMNETGGYNQGDVDYAKSLDDYDLRNENETNILIERIQKRGVIGTLLHIFDKKMTRTWGNSLLGSDDYISRQPIHPDSLIEKIFAQSGVYHGFGLIISWTYHITLLVGAMLSIVFALKNNLEVNFLQLSIVGICVFLSVWECNSRYLFTYVPVIYMCAADGWLRVRIIDKDLKKKEK